MPVKAKESAQISKARKKIKEQILSQNKLTTSQALEKMTKWLQSWLARHAKERINLKEKRVVNLFDENQHPANTQSKYVSHLLKSLKKELRRGASPKSLGGRVKAH